MNYNKKGQNNRHRIAAVIAIGILLTAGIVFLKTTTQNNAEKNTDPATTDRETRIAVPDTTADTTSLPPVADTIAVSSLPDSILGRDKRGAYEAGYEDGYATGCDDGASDTRNAGYDESSTFASSADRTTYARGYQEGYAKGFEDGRDGKQFNISAGQQ